MISSISKAIPVPNKEGIPFIVGSVAVTLFFYFIGWETLGNLMLVVTIWCVYFFRDPERFTPVGDGLIVSPADGVVSMITQAVPPAELEMGEEPLTRISVFLNIFNVHINRVPVAGTITRLYYFAGKFFNAELDKASEENERQMVRVTTADGKEVGFVQIAGLIARRIVCYLKEGQEVTTGERFGLIRFGSRMDIFLPKGIAPLVVTGQIAVAGETVLADLQGAQKIRVGIKH